MECNKIYQRLVFSRALLALAALMARGLTLTEVAPLFPWKLKEKFTVNWELGTPEG